MATVSLVGRLTGDPVLKNLEGGRQVVDFDLADNHGENETTFYSCGAFGKQAELIVASCKKGHRLYVSGTLKSRKYTGNNGQAGMSLDLTVNEFRFIEAAPQPAAAPAPAPAPGYAPPAAPGYAAPAPTPQPQYHTDQAGNVFQLINNQWALIRPAAAAPPAPPAGAPPAPGNRPY